MRIFLLPLSWLFRIIVFIRNKLYDFGYIRPVFLQSRVISIGNISTGGTGKTPLTEIIAKYCLQKNQFVIIITKGYKREIDDMQVVELGYEDYDRELTSENFGDESMMILEDFSREKNGKGLLVVSENKRIAAKLADSKFKPDIIVIDDGFQTRKIARDFDIVVLSPKYKGRLLPAGNFREPYSSTKRANINVLNYKFEDSDAFNLTKLGNIPAFKYELEGFYNVKGETADLREKKAIAFCGIGDPDSFRMLLYNNKIDITKFLSFPDHFNFENEDIKKIIEEYYSNKADVIITTQKDFVRFKYSFQAKSRRENPVKDLLFYTPSYYTKIQLKFTQNRDILFNNIDKLIKVPQIVEEKDRDIEM